MSPTRRLNDRHPFEVYLLGLALLTNAPAAFGFVEPPASVRAQMPEGAAQLWSLGLTLGCLVAVVGLAWPRPPRPLLTTTGLLLERVGLIVVAWSTVFYAVAVMCTAGWAGLAAAGIVLAFGLASAAQARKIRRTLRDSRPAPERIP